MPAAEFASVTAGDAMFNAFKFMAVAVAFFGINFAKTIFSIMFWWYFHFLL